MPITPKGYGTTCTISMLRAGTAGNGWKDDTADAIKDGFEESVDYRIVYKNMNYDTTYKTWIYEGNASEKTVGYLHLMSYPYDDVRFKIGDYVQFDYDHNNVMPPEYKFWLIQSLDHRHLYNVHGRILPCNSALRWQDNNGNNYSYPCYFNTEMTKTNILDSGQGFNVESGALIAIVQQNSDTNTIYINQRFILGGRAYIVYQFNNNIDEGLIYVYLRMTAELPEDDLINGYAYNGFDLQETVTLNGDVLNIDNDITLLQDDDIIIRINNYVLGIMSKDTYTVTPYDVPTKYYELTDIDGNEFVVKNVKQYKSHPLKLEFTNQTTGNVTTAYIWLGGAL